MSERFVILQRVVDARDASPKARIPADLEIAINAARAAVRTPSGDAEFKAGRDARIRAAGFAGLLSEIVGAGVLRESAHPDLYERVQRALAEQEAVFASVTAAAA